MSIYFRFGDFRANSRSIYVLFLGKVMPNFCMTLMHACIFIINLFIITAHAFMVISGTVVDRLLRSAVQDMKENNLTEVLCPCRKCKGIVWLNPYDDGRVEAHLLMTGFMDGYTRWIIEDEEDDDVEDADGAGNDDMGQDEEMVDNGGGEEAGHGGGEGAGHGGGEGAGHGGG